jgi:hypothetical protein
VPTYDLSLARKFAEVAEETIAREPENLEARRVVAYISRLSMELSLKAFLERVGVPVDEIKKHWHDLRGLLKEVDTCEVEVDFSPGSKRWMPATRVRSVEIQFQGYSTTLGVVLEAEDHGASKYPNELRYGEVPKDFPPEALSRAATSLANWVSEHWGAARKNS